MSFFRIANPKFKVAVKVYKLKGTASELLPIVKEIVTLKSFDHPGTIRIHEIFKHKRKLYIVWDLVEGVPLFDYLIERDNLDEKDAIYVIRQLCQTIKYLHSKSVIHRDLKPENIIINPKTLQVKVIDFGSSSFFTKKESLKTKIGTAYYVAPEVLKGAYNKEWDVWSLGIIAYVLLTGCPPFQAEDPQKIYWNILKDKVAFYQTHWTNLSKESLDFVKRILKHKDPKKRMTIDEALNHPWLKEEKEDLYSIESEIVQRIWDSYQPDILRNEMLLLLSTNINAEIFKKWNTVFWGLDKEWTGLISIQDFANKYYTPKNEELMNSEIHKKSKNNSKISYSDFLSKVINFEQEIEGFDFSSISTHFGKEEGKEISQENIYQYMKRKGGAFIEENSNILYDQIWQYKVVREEEDRESFLFQNLESLSNENSTEVIYSQNYLLKFIFPFDVQVMLSENYNRKSY